MAFTPAADSAGLQAQLKEIQAEIKRRGGAAKAPGFAAQLKQVQGAIAALPTQSPNDPGTQPPVQGPPTAPPTSGPSMSQPLVDDGTKPKTFSDLTNTGGEVAAKEASQGAGFVNADTQGPNGNQQWVQDPATGRWTSVDTLSAGNQQAQNDIQGSSHSASSELQNTLGTFDNLGHGSGAATDQYGQPVQAGNNRFEQSVFDQLTSGLDQQQSQESEALQQQLANQGLDPGGDAYINQMHDLNTRYDNQRNNARATAVQQSTQNSISASNVLGNLQNSGYFNPNFAAYNQPQYNAPSATDVYTTIGNQNIAQQQADTQRLAAQKSGGGGGRSSGGGTPAPTQAFFSSYPPGYQG